MGFKVVFNNISTSNELNRVANAYVIDFRSLSRQNLVEAIIKPAPQYSHKGNVQKTLGECLYHDNRDLRIITPILIKYVLLNKDDYKFEQQIVNKSNEFSIAKNYPRKHELELFSFVLETAWDSEDSISVNEENLIVKIQHKLCIS